MFKKIKVWHGVRQVNKAIRELELKIAMYGVENIEATRFKTDYVDEDATARLRSLGLAYWTNSEVTTVYSPK